MDHLKLFSFYYTNQGNSQSLAKYFLTQTQKTGQVMVEEFLQEDSEPGLKNFVCTSYFLSVIRRNQKSQPIELFKKIYEKMNPDQRQNLIHELYTDQKSSPLEWLQAVDPQSRFLNVEELNLKTFVLKTSLIKAHSGIALRDNLKPLNKSYPHIEVEYDKLDNLFGFKEADRLRLRNFSEPQKEEMKKIKQMIHVYGHGYSTDLFSACAWKTMESSLSKIISQSSNAIPFPPVGMDGQTYWNMPALVDTYIKNSFIKANIMSLIEKKIAKCRAAESESSWLHLFLHLKNPVKNEPTRKSIKI